MRPQAAALGAILSMGCGSTTSVVPTGPHPSGSSHEVVTEPPPAARVEVLPLARGSECRWLGGNYERVGSTWRWKQGSWVRPPEGCFYAPPVTRYEETKIGTALVHRPGAWFPRKPGEACEAVAPCEPE